VVFFFLSFGSWAFLIHRTVNQLAIYQMPKQMQPFFYENIDYLVQHSVRPDQTLLIAKKNTVVEN